MTVVGALAILFIGIVIGAGGLLAIALHYAGEDNNKNHNKN